MKYFVYFTVQSGANTIVRRSDESSVTIPFERTFRSLTGDPRDESETSAAFNFCGCGWPQHMLVPKGTAKGADYQVFAMISNYDLDVVCSFTCKLCIFKINSKTNMRFLLNIRLSKIHLECRVLMRSVSAESKTVFILIAGPWAIHSTDLLMLVLLQSKISCNRIWNFKISKYVSQILLFKTLGIQQRIESNMWHCKKEYRKLNEFLFILCYTIHNLSLS